MASVVSVAALAACSEKRGAHTWPHLIYDRTSQNMCTAVTPSLFRAKRCHRSNFYQRRSWEAAKSDVGTLSTGANHNLGAAVRYVMRPPPFCRAIAIIRRALAGLFAAREPINASWIGT